MWVVGVVGVCVCARYSTFFNGPSYIWYVSVQVSNSLRPLLLVWGVAEKAPPYASMHTHISIYIYIYDCLCVSLCVCVFMRMPASSLGWLLAHFMLVFCVICFWAISTYFLRAKGRKAHRYTHSCRLIHCVFIYIYVGPSAMWAVGIGFIVVMFASSSCSQRRKAACEIHKKQLEKKQKQKKNN